MVQEGGLILSSQYVKCGGVLSRQEEKDLTVYTEKLSRYAILCSFFLLFFNEEKISIPMYTENYVQYYAYHFIDFIYVVHLLYAIVFFFSNQYY